MQPLRNPMVASSEDAPSHVERSIDLASSAADVWASITEPGRFAEWFGADVEGDLRRHARLTFRWPGDVERVAVVESVEPDRLLAFRWMPFVTVDGERRAAGTGRVELSVEPTPGGTRVTVAEWTSLPRSQPAWRLT